MKNYKRGANKEYAFAKHLEDVYTFKGYKVGKLKKVPDMNCQIIRTAGSHSTWDIILFDYKKLEIHCFQLKYSPSYTITMKKELKEMQKLPRIISVWRHFVWYRKGDSEPIFIWSEK